MRRGRGPAHLIWWDKLSLSSFWHNGRMPDEHTHPLRAAQRGEDYRVLAKAIRAVAVRTRLPAARRELGQLAAKYERQAEHLDRR